MAEATEPRIPCPACGARYKWVAEVAGRKIKCRCGALMRMPRDPEGQAMLEKPPPQAPASPPPQAPGKSSPPAAKHKPQPAAPPVQSSHQATAHVPPTPPAAAKEDDAGYDLEIPELAELTPQAKAPASTAAPIKSAAPGKCPSCGQPVKPTAVICLNCGFNLQSGEKIHTAIEEDAPAPAAGHKPVNKSGADKAAEGSRKRKLRTVSIALIVIGLLGIAAYVLLVFFKILK